MKILQRWTVRFVLGSLRALSCVWAQPYFVCSVQIATHREHFRAGLEPDLAGASSAGAASSSAALPDLAVRLDEAVAKLDKLKQEKALASSGLMFYKRFLSLGQVTCMPARLHTCASPRAHPLFSFCGVRESGEARVPALYAFDG